MWALSVSHGGAVAKFPGGMDGEVFHVGRGGCLAVFREVSSSPCSAPYAAIISRHYGISCAHRVKPCNVLYPFSCKRYGPSFSGADGCCTIEFTI